MSKDEPSPGGHHTVVFDVLKTNVGNAYNKYSGMFTAPTSGLYYFSLTLHVFCYAEIFAVIVKNDEVIGSTVADSDEVCDNHSATSNIIIEMNQGDVAFVRTSSTATSYGNIRSNVDRRSSFSGFKLY